MHSIMQSLDSQDVGSKTCSTVCRKHEAPSNIAENRKGDSAVMNMDFFERLLGVRDLYGFIDKRAGNAHMRRTIPLVEAVHRIEATLRW